MGQQRVRVGWSRDAGRDRDDIFSHIAADNFTAAVANDEKFAAAEMQLTRFPQSGRTGRVEGPRELVIPGTPFILIYGLGQDQLVVLRVIHAAQKWPGDQD